MILMCIRRVCALHAVEGAVWVWALKLCLNPQFHQKIKKVNVKFEIEKINRFPCSWLKHGAVCTHGHQ